MSAKTLHAHSFRDEHDVCDYVEKHGIMQGNIQNIIFDDKWKWYVLFYWE